VTEFGRVTTLKTITPMFGWIKNEIRDRQPTLYSCIVSCLRWEISLFHLNFLIVSRGVQEKGSIEGAFTHPAIVHQFLLPRGRP